MADGPPKLVEAIRFHMRRARTGIRLVLLALGLVGCARGGVSQPLARPGPASGTRSAGLGEAGSQSGDTTVGLQTLENLAWILPWAAWAAVAAAFWQGHLTRRALADQRKHFEMDASPWLTGSSLKPQRVEEDPMRLQMDSYLVLRNVGKTPAIAVSVESAWTLTEGDEGRQMSGSKEYHMITIAPEDELHVNLCRLPYEDPRQRGRINTVVRYSTLFGGTGEIGLTFIERGEGGWYNGPSTYKFTGADRSEYGQPPPPLELRRG